MGFLHKFSFFLLAALTLPATSQSATPNQRLKTAKRLFHEGKSQQGQGLLRQNLKGPSPHRASVEYYAQRLQLQGRHLDAAKVYRQLIGRYVGKNLLRIRTDEEAQQALTNVQRQSRAPLTKRELFYLKGLEQNLMQVAENSRESHRRQLARQFQKRATRLRRKMQEIVEQKGPLSQRRQTIEQQAKKNMAAENYGQALLNYRQLIQRGPGAPLLAAKSKSAVRSFFQSASLPSRGSHYFRQIARILNTMASQEREFLDKEKLQKIIRLRNKYAYIAKTAKAP